MRAAFFLAVASALVAVNATEAKEAERKAEELKNLGEEETKLERKLSGLKKTEARVEQYVPAAYQHFALAKDNQTELKLEGKIAAVKAEELKAGAHAENGTVAVLELAANATEEAKKEENDLAKDVTELSGKEAKLERKLGAEEKNDANVLKYVPKAYQAYAINASAKEEKKLKDAIAHIQDEVAKEKAEEAAAKASALNATLVTVEEVPVVPVKFLAAAASAKAEPVEAEPAKAEPVKAEPVKAEPVEKAEPVKAEAKNATKESTMDKMINKYVPEAYRAEALGENTTSHETKQKTAEDMINQYVPTDYRKYALLDFHTRVHAAKAQAAKKAAKTGLNTTEPLDYAGLALLSTARAAEQSRQPVWFAPVAGCALFVVMFQAFYRPSRTVSQTPLLG